MQSRQKQEAPSHSREHGSTTREKKKSATKRGTSNERDAISLPKHTRRWIPLRQRETATARASPSAAGEAKTQTTSATNANVPSPIPCSPRSNSSSSRKFRGTAHTGRPNGQQAGCGQRNDTNKRPGTRKQCIHQRQRDKSVQQNTGVGQTPVAKMPHPTVAKHSQRTAALPAEERRTHEQHNRHSRPSHANRWIKREDKPHEKIPRRAIPSQRTLSHGDEPRNPRHSRRHPPRQTTKQTRKYVDRLSVTNALGVRQTKGRPHPLRCAGPTHRGRQRGDGTRPRQVLLALVTGTGTACGQMGPPLSPLMMEFRAHNPNTCGLCCTETAIGCHQFQAECVLGQAGELSVAGLVTSPSRTWSGFELGERGPTHRASRLPRPSRPSSPGCGALAFPPTASPPSSLTRQR